VVKRGQQAQRRDFNGAVEVTLAVDADGRLVTSIENGAERFSGPLD
jgi:hypothetical protein